MKSQIYQNGFYLLIGFLIGCIIGLSYNNSPNLKEIKIEVMNDSARIVPENVAVLKKELTPSNLKAELKKHNIPHAKIVYAQAKLESNLGKSSVYKRTNNLFGLRKGNKYRSYSHWTDCVKDYKKCISSRYTGGSYYTFLDKIGYAEDSNYISKLRELI